MKKTSLLLIPAALILLAGCQAQNQSQVTVTVNDDPSDAVVSSTIVSAPTTSTVKTTSSATSSSPQKITAVIPASLELPVAFASQAPFGNWDKIHEETCEEASMINVAKYYAKQSACCSSYTRFCFVFS